MISFDSQLMLFNLQSEIVTIQIVVSSPFNSPLISFKSQLIFLILILFRAPLTRSLIHIWYCLIWIWLNSLLNAPFNSHLISFQIACWSWLISQGNMVKMATIRQLLGQLQELWDVYGSSAYNESKRVFRSFFGLLGWKAWFL